MLRFHLISSYIYTCTCTCTDYDDHSSFSLLFLTYVYNYRMCLFVINSCQILSSSCLCLSVCQFAPFSGDTVVLSGAEDREVRLHDLNNFETVKVDALSLSLSRSLSPSVLPILEQCT